MIYLILSIILFLLAVVTYRKEKLNKFRRQLVIGDRCTIYINGLPYSAEIEAITGSSVYVVINNKDTISFNNRFHITEIYPPTK